MFRIALILTFAAAAAAQSATPNSIQATGIATINVQPDQVQLTVSVSTDAPTAQQATQQNATQANTLLTALKQVLGTSGNIQTVGYSVYPRYSNGPNPSIIGYTATNTVQVTSYDLTLAGPLIDAAGQAGASGVSSLSFGLKDPDPAKQQALTAAAKQALAHTAAIAAGLGAHARRGRLRPGERRFVLASRTRRGRHLRYHHSRPNRHGHRHRYGHRDGAARPVTAADQVT